MVQMYYHSVLHTAAHIGRQTVHPLTPYTSRHKIAPKESSANSMSMNRLTFTSGAIVLACTVLVGSCRQKTSTVEVIPRTTGTLLWEPMHMGVAEAARERGLHVYWNAPTDEGDVERQLSFITVGRKRGFCGLILVPDETLASRSPVLDAVKAGEPVVIVDDQLGPPPGPYLSYVANDEEAGARLAADRIAKMLHGSGSIAIIGISPRLDSGILREESFEKALSTVAPGVRIEGRRYGDSVAAHQQQIAEEILNGHGHIDAVVALTATATMGAYLAKMAMDSPSLVKIVGFDQGFLLPIQSGDIDAVVLQNTRTIGQIAMRNMDAQLRGQPVRGLTLVPPMLLTKETFHAQNIQSLWDFVHYRWSSQ
jgi:ribose transport system substrate-binding protein